MHAAYPQKPGALLSRICLVSDVAHVADFATAEWLQVVESGQAAFGHASAVSCRSSEANLVSLGAHD